MKLRNYETDNYIIIDKSDSEYTVIDNCSVTTIESNITSDDSKKSWSPSSNDSNQSSDDCNTSIDTSDDSNQSSEVCNLNNEFSNVGNNSIVSNVDHPCKLDAINNSIRKKTV